MRVHLIHRRFLFPGAKILLDQLIRSLKIHEKLATSMLSLSTTFDKHYTPKNGM